MAKASASAGFYPAIREVWGCASAHRDEEAPEGGPYLLSQSLHPDRAPSPLHGPQPESTLPVSEQNPTEAFASPHDSSPHPAERRPPPHLELGLAGSASAPWNMVALSSSAPQPHSNRAAERASRPALPDHCPI